MASQSGDNNGNEQEPEPGRYQRIPRSPTIECWHPKLKFVNNTYRPAYTFEEPLPEDQRAADEQAAIERYVGIGVGWVSLVTENLLSHPFVVLRRQCQVNNASRCYHLAPFSLLPVLIHLHQRQGATMLWKGVGSVLLVRAMSMAIEDLISVLTSWPKEMDGRCWNVGQLMRHAALKCCSLAIVTPFYAASLVETVQSEIASERPAALDVFREGCVRLMHWGGGGGRLLSVWALVLPTVALGLARHLFILVVRGSTCRLLQTHERCPNARALPTDIVTHCSATAGCPSVVNAAIVSVLAADVIFYPLETVLHRLHLQGTRTIVDNLDTGRAVLPILTNYEGAVDCYDKTVAGEGTAGLYKGFGAMILQYTVHYMLVRATRFLLTEVTSMLRSKIVPDIPPPPPTNLNRHESPPAPVGHYPVSP